jgi:hypothetical protein
MSRNVDNYQLALRNIPELRGPHLHRDASPKSHNLDFKIRRVLNVVSFLLGNSPASEVYMPTFRNTLYHLHRQVGVCRMHLGAHQLCFQAHLSPLNMHIFNSVRRISNASLCISPTPVATVPFVTDIAFVKTKAFQ